MCRIALRRWRTDWGLSDCFMFLSDLQDGIRQLAAELPCRDERLI